MERKLNVHKREILIFNLFKNTTENHFYFLCSLINNSLWLIKTIATTNILHP